VIAALRVLGATIFIVLITWALLVLAISLFGKRDEARTVEAIVVLGAAQYDGRPSPVLRARLDHALQLFEDGVAPKIIFTGGVGVGDTVSEAEVGRRYALRAGVPDSAILLERAGLSTAESLAAVAELMEEAGMDTAVLVSDPFHMLRLRILASRHGLRAYSSPTRTSPISSDPGLEWRHVIRESLVLPATLLRGS
jgi:uncharacterized SAM-binding protein YcdF (DUF218 family)